MIGREDDQRFFDLWLFQYKFKGLKQREGDGSSHTRQAAELVRDYREN